MSTFHREFTDAAFTRTLDQWLDDGPTSAPDFTLEAALRMVATTRQRQLRGRLLRMADSSGPVVPVSLTLAGLTAVVLVAIGLGLNNHPPPGVVDTPAPTAASETSDPASVPYGFELFRNEPDGYEVLIHRSWDLAVEPAYGEPRPGVSRFEEARSVTGRSPLVISVGSPDGSIYLCESKACNRVIVGNITVLESEIKETWQPGGLGEQFSEVIEPTVLGGEPARFRYPTGGNLDGSTMGVPGACSAFGFHDRRPIVLTFNCDYFRQGQPALMGTMQTTIDSFRFLDDAPDPGWQRLSFPEAGFAVEVPLGFSSLDLGDPYWETIAGPGGALAVRSSDAQNKVHGDSVPRSANALDDLVAIVAEEFQDLRALAAAPEIATEAFDLGGDPAAWVTLTPRPGETSPQLTEFGATAQHVLAIHDGRPFIITWLGEYEQTFRDLLARFEFLE